MPKATVLVSQPALSDPRLFDSALGLQHYWSQGLSTLDFVARPSLHFCSDAMGRRRAVYREHPCQTLHEAAASRSENFAATHTLQSHFALDPSGRLRGCATLTRSAPARRLVVLEGGGDELGVLRFADRVLDVVARRLGPVCVNETWETRLRTGDAVDAFARLLVCAGLVRQAHGLLRRPVLDRIAAEWPQSPSGWAAR